MRERLRRFNEDRTRMMAAMSHDLRTPLTRLRMRIEMAQGLEDQQKMLDELDMMNGMVESILSFTRDDSKQEARSLVDLSALVEGICEDAVDAGETVTFSGPRDVTISCRPTAMRRAISNLVDNAIKYGGKADVTLAAEAERVVITVEDEGPGIPGASGRRCSSHSTGSAALVIPALVGSVSAFPSLARSSGNTAETSSSAIARAGA